MILPSCQNRICLAAVASCAERVGVEVCRMRGYIFVSQGISVPFRL